MELEYAKAAKPSMYQSGNTCTSVPTVLTAAPQNQKEWPSKVVGGKLCRILCLQWPHKISTIIDNSPLLFSWTQNLFYPMIDHPLTVYK